MKASQIILRLALVAAVVAFIHFLERRNQHQKSNLQKTTFVLSGVSGMRIRLEAVPIEGGRFEVSTGIRETEIPVLTATNREFASCRLERLAGDGVITLKIMEDTNLVSTIELPADRRVLELKRNGWTHKYF